MLTYGHIVDNLNSDSNSLVLSAKQGKILNNKIDNIDLSGIDNNIGLLNERIDVIEEKMTDNEVITALDNRITENTNNISELNNNLTYLNNNTVFYNHETDCIDVYSNGILIGSISTGIKDPVKLTPTLTMNSERVFCKTEYSTSGYDAWRAFDGIKNQNNASLWMSEAGSGTTLSEYIGYNFDTNKTVVKFKIFNRASGNNSARAIKDFKLQGSNNKSDWYDIQSYVNPSSASGVASEFYVDTPQTFKMFRLYITSAYGAVSGDTRACLAELEFYGN